MNELVREYNEYEDSLIKKFNEDTFYGRFENFSKERFTYYLLQLGFLSMEFVKFIERAKLGVQSPLGKEAVREILRDEIPSQGPTHQDNRVADLRKAGLSFSQILDTPASQETKDIIEEYYHLIRYPETDYDLKVLIVLRVIGEVLVGETYRHVVKGLAKHFGMKPEDSLFYTFHWMHDQKGGTGDTGGSGHTEYYERVLEELITTPEKLDIAKDSALKAFEVRTKFHKQF